MYAYPQGIYVNCAFTNASAAIIGLVILHTYMYDSSRHSQAVHNDGCGLSNKVV